MRAKQRSADTFQADNGYFIEDVWYPRVTRIVAIKAKPALDKFYKEVGGITAGQAIAAKSAEEGTLVHEIIEALLLGQRPDIPPAISAAVTAFQEFIANRHIQTVPEHVERRIWHREHRYAGTVDVLAEIDGKFGVLDIKTSGSIYRDYNLQTAAYMDALQEEFPKLQTRWILRVDQIQLCTLCRASRRVKGGREKVREIYSPYGACQAHLWGPLQGQIEFQEFPEWQHDLQGFLGAKRLWEWENYDVLRRIGYLE